MDFIFNYRNFIIAKPPIKSNTKIIDRRFRFFSINDFIGSP